MKNTFIKALICLLIVSCSKNDTNNNCNYLVNAGVNFNANLNLPQFNNLLTTSNSVYVANQGNGGVFVINVGSGLRAWDAADPNHAFSNCSIMTINGINVTCNCDDENEYTLFTGQPLNNPELACGLKEYRVESVGNNSYLISN